ncbi:hypothetical protein [Silvibacterium dinghuense]|uniref:hypothetical protein n=1 Tax=Silvibacterium dinghuense TaxID=1560006 RepID=UPI00100DD22F|nr:hypothetical protein [Silvibacterium dinghuense]GGH08792.1 hypothetical protein GCM10011586_26530 [Silvibacterium dinghuense]
MLLRIVESQELRRSARLRELLLYLGRCHQSGAGNVREQEVGAAVFGRAEDYDTTLDNIVRVNVSELRKRLAHYFQEEGAQEPVIVEIPRGGYLPKFVRRTFLEEPEPQPAQEATPLATAVAGIAAVEAGAVIKVGRAERNPRRWLVTVLVLLMLVAGAGCGVLIWQNAALRTELHPWTADPALESLWSQFFATGREVDIVSADTSYALEEDVLRQPISLEDYLNYNYKRLGNRSDVPQATRDALEQILDRDSGSIGDFQVAVRILRLGGHDEHLKVTSARFYSPESLKTNDLILIGSQQSNPWVELFRDRLNFYPEYDLSLHRSFVHNRVPAKGEQAVYTAAEEPNRGYSVIAFLPNLNDRQNTLILAGTDSRATQAAGDFITSRSGMREIAKRLPVGPYPHFEVLLSSSQLVGTPLHTEVVTVRVFDH